MTETLSIECGPADDRGRRHVLTIYGDRSHTDHIDVDSSFQRQKWCEAVVRRLNIAAPWMPEHNDDGAAVHAELEAKLQAAANAEDERAERDGAGRWQPTLKRMADVAACPIRWLWPDRIALGRLSLLVGMPGAGKSFLTCDMAARISTGTPWPDGAGCERGSVLLVTAEDDPGDTIRPRLDAHGADAKRIHLLTGLHRHGTGGERAELMFSLSAVDALETALKQLKDCRLIVIDPIGSFLGARTDAHRDNEVRAVLAPIGRLAEDYGVAVLVVAHRRKSGGATADDTALGSRAFTGIARNVWHLSRDAETRGRRLLLPGKANLTAEPTGLAFSIAGDPGAVHWERDPVAMTADDALAQEQGDRGEASSALDEAVAWLREALAGGPKPSKQLREDARRDGIAPRTLDRAKGKLRIEASPDGFGGQWVWKLPDGASVSQDFTEFAKSETLAHSGETVAHSERSALTDEQRQADEAAWVAASF